MYQSYTFLTSTHTSNQSANFVDSPSRIHSFNSPPHLMYCATVTAPTNTSSTSSYSVDRFCPIPLLSSTVSTPISTAPTYTQLNTIKKDQHVEPPIATSPAVRFTPAPSKSLTSFPTPVLTPQNTESSPQSSVRQYQNHNELRLVTSPVVDIIETFEGNVSSSSDEDEIPTISKKKRRSSR